MKFNFLRKPKPSANEKGDWHFKMDKGKYEIEYVFLTEKNKLFTVFDSVKHLVPKAKKNEAVFDSGKELILLKSTLPKIEKAIITAVKPDNVFKEIKQDKPNFKYYNIKLSYASIKKTPENLFLMKINLTGLCDE